MNDDSVSKTDAQLVIFRLNEEEFGIEINQVREIVFVTNITHLPASLDNFILGVINLRGQIIPIVDVAKQLGLPAVSVSSKTTRIIIAEVNKNAFGMLVDEVPQVLKIPYENIDETPELIKQKIKADYFKGVGKLEDRLIIIIDIEKLMHSTEVTLETSNKDNGNG